MKIGGLSLQAHEAREEQDGTKVRKLPVATDPRFIVEEQKAETNTPTAIPGTDTDAEGVEEAETTNKEMEA